MERKSSEECHVILLPYPGQGHINPMTEFARRLVSRGIRATLVTTVFISNSLKLGPTIGHVHHDVISDGFDDSGRYGKGRTLPEYLEKAKEVGSRSLSELIEKYKSAPFGQPVDCVVYEPFLPWALDVAKEHGLYAAPFFTQPCAVDYVYYNVWAGSLGLPVDGWPVEIPGLPVMEAADAPSFLVDPVSSKDFLGLLVNQFSNAERADCFLINTFYELEKEVVDTFSKICPILPIGPTIPSNYLTTKPSMTENGKYGLDLFEHDESIPIKWLSNKPLSSVIYVAFGSRASLTHTQMEELALGLKQTAHYFLWVVRETEQAKLPKQFLKSSGNDNKGLVVKWSPQLKILANKAIGCFLTHCGWNSTIEALSLGVPMVAMPIWSDQPANASFVEKVWKVGVRVRVSEKNGVVGRDEIERCIREVMDGTGMAMKKNATKWREAVVKAVGKGGSSFRNIDDFVAKITTHKKTFETRMLIG
uniref:Glycosyltransferase n=1 Tax=Linum usitatissimum TaxID=4006 RepID=I2BH61_LINUS|nr:UDP-glycosyltransferase 1 [Linum usitatissimum]AGD95008.1 UDP-glucosyltransferase [Linum usitatissimum]